MFWPLLCSIQVRQFNNTHTWAHPAILNWRFMSLNIVQVEGFQRLLAWSGLEKDTLRGLLCMSAELWAKAEAHAAAAVQPDSTPCCFICPQEQVRARCIVLWLAFQHRTAMMLGLCHALGWQQEGVSELHVLCMLMDTIKV